MFELRLRPVFSLCLNLTIFDYPPTLNKLCLQFRQRTLGFTVNAQVLVSQPQHLDTVRASYESFRPEANVSQSIF